MKTSALFSLVLFGLPTCCLLAATAPAAHAGATSGSWAYVTDDGVQRYNATLTQFSNGNVLITSGTTFNTAAGVIADTEIFNPTANVWTQTAPLLVGPHPGSSRIAAERFRAGSERHNQRF